MACNPVSCDQPTLHKTLEKVRKKKDFFIQYETDVVMMSDLFSAHKEVLEINKVGFILHLVATAETRDCSRPYVPSK